jgi:signal transduction histidine kinase/CheY-like chemotaxis protein
VRVVWAEEAENAICSMAHCITSATNVHSAQRGLLRAIYELLRPKACYISRYSSERDELQVTGARGRVDKRIAAVRPGEGPVGQAFLEGRIMRDEEMVVAPLVRGGSVVGCLAILSPQKATTDALLAALAAQISAAFEVARLRDEMARRNKDLQTALAGLKSLQKNRELLISNVSHDLKNPLTPIKAYLGLIERGTLGEITPRQTEALKVIERNADRLMRMISDVVLMSRLQSGKMTLHQRPFGLKALAEQVIQTLTTVAEQVKATLALSPRPEVFVRGDPDRIGEAIFNLVENALFVSGEGGSVEVSISSKNGFVVLSVRDSGPGMVPEDQERVFDALLMGAAPKPYYGSPRRLSLPLVAKIAHLHGGRAEITSKLGQGSTLRIYLPEFAAVVARQEAQSVPGEGTILLVEDNVDVREVLREMLEEHGYSVTSSSTAGQALSLLHEVRPALVLLDWRLSDDDGRSVLHFIRFTPSLANTVVFVISGASEIGSLSSESGPDRVDGFFEKPLNVPKLMSAISSVVRPKSPSLPRN